MKRKKLEDELKKLGGFFGMEETMIFGPMAIGKNQSLGTMKLMKSLLVQFYARQKAEAKYEIFRKNI